MLDIYIGIDPSITSTGICVRIVNASDGSDAMEPFFYIVRSHKLTKRERIAQEKYVTLFEYILYDAIDEKAAEAISPSSFAYAKTINLMKVVDEIKGIIRRLCQRMGNGINSISICIEGISYGSTHGTKSIFDLAGLNYMIRSAILNMNLDNLLLVIAPPSVIKKFATGKGNVTKDMMIEVFSTIYKDFELPKIDDIVDAYFMSKWAQLNRERNS